MNDRAIKIHDAAVTGDKDALANILPAATHEDFNYEVEVNGWPMSALLASSRNGHAEVVKMFIESKMVDVNQRDSKFGYTALMLAAFKGHVPVIEVLFRAGADINAQDEAGYTALLLAISSSHIAAVEVLLQAGADVHAQSKDGQTALSLANNNEVLMLVQKHTTV